jgi:hypothetical protein
VLQPGHRATARARSHPAAGHERQPHRSRNRLQQRANPRK